MSYTSDPYYVRSRDPNHLRKGLSAIQENCEWVREYEEELGNCSITEFVRMMAIAEIANYVSEALEGRFYSGERI